MSASSLEFVPTLEMCLENDARHNSMKSKFTTSVVLQLDNRQSLRKSSEEVYARVG